MKYCPNCGHGIKYHKPICWEGDRSWTCGCADTKFKLSKLTDTEREAYKRGVAAGRLQMKRRMAK